MTREGAPERRGRQGWASLVTLAGLAAASWARGEAAPPATDPDGDGDEVGEIVVPGVRPLLGDRIPLQLQDAPLTATVLSERLIQAQSADRLETALQNVPGITLNAGEGAARGDTIDIRGFSAFNDFFLDGIRDAAVYNRDTFDLQSVEVLEGPSATLFGRGSTGGAVNQVSKAPELAPFDVLTVEGGTNAAVRSTVDLDAPLGGSAAARLNAMAETSGVAGRSDLLRNRRWGVAPAVSVGIGKPTTVTLSYLHLQQDDTPDTGVPFVGSAPAPVPRDADFGLQSDRATAQVDVGTLRLTHEISPAVSVAATARAARYGFGDLFDAPNFGAAAPDPATPLAEVRVGRDSPSSSGVQSNLTGQFDLTARFRTGPLDHVLVTGVEIARQTNDLVRYVNPFGSNPSWIAPTPLLDPDPYETRPTQLASATQRTLADSEGVYATDTAHLGSRLDLIAGVRLDRFAAAYHQVRLSTGAILDLQRTDVVASPRLAATFKPTPWESLYVSYGTSFDPSAEALALTAATANLGPVKATSYEAGSKTRVLSGALLLTAAVFRTTVDNAQTDDPDNPTQTVLEGKVRVQGVELGATGRLTRHWEITAGYDHLDGVTTGVAPTGPYADVAVPNLARDAASLWTEYELGRFEIGGGVRYQSRRAADIVAPGVTPAFAPAYAVFDAMASWQASRRLLLQINALNLTDKLYYGGLYYTSAAENHVVPGPGRTVRLTAKVSF